LIILDVLQHEKSSLINYCFPIVEAFGHGQLAAELFYLNSFPCSFSSYFPKEANVLWLEGSVIASEDQHFSFIQNGVAWVF
jgi:hypothetical protein